MCKSMSVQWSIVQSTDYSGTIQDLENSDTAKPYSTGDSFLLVTQGNNIPKAFYGFIRGYDHKNAYIVHSLCGSCLLLPFLIRSIYRAFINIKQAEDLIQFEQCEMWLCSKYHLIN